MKIADRLSFEKRLELAKHPLSKKILQIMIDKTTNLSAAADFTSADSILKFADEVGPYICILKIHADIIDDFGFEFIKKLKILAEKHNFVIFEDRKFADIGATVKAQFESGPLQIADWADLVNAHLLPGPGIIDGLKAARKNVNQGLLLIAQLSSAGNLIDQEYIEKTRIAAEENSDFVMGFISQSKISEDPGMLHMTPGVKIGEGGDNLSQQYLTPERAINERGADIVIVGRGLSQAKDVPNAAKEYRKQAWCTYISNVS